MTKVLLISLVLGTMVCLALIFIGYKRYKYVPSAYALISSKGYRYYMEDRYCIDLKDGMRFYGVFDGHEGMWLVTKLSTSLSSWLFKGLGEIAGLGKARVLDKQLLEAVKAKIKEMYLSFDKYLVDLARKEGRKHGGSTATVVLGIKDYWFFVNLGDSRAIYVCDGKLALATEGYKFSGEKEEHILRSSYRSWGVPRALGFSISKSRHSDNQVTIDEAGVRRHRSGLLCAEPDVMCIKKSSKRGFIVVASDGLWDGLSSQQVADEVCRYADEGPEQVCSRLFRKTEHRGFGDNTTILVVKTPLKEGVEAGVILV